MKKLLLTLPALLVAGAVNAQSIEAVNIDLIGEIAPRCEMSLHSTSGEISLLAGDAGLRQEIAQVGLWCNYTQSVDVEYSSLGNGAMRPTGDTLNADTRIDYQLAHGEDTFRVTTPAVKTQSVASGIADLRQMVQPLYIITDKSVRSRNAGEYTDTITLSFAAK